MLSYYVLDLSNSSKHELKGALAPVAQDLRSENPIPVQPSTGELGCGNSSMARKQSSLNDPIQARLQKILLSNSGLE